MTKYARAGRTFSRRGQTMLIAVLALGGSIMGVTTIAGLLMVYQLRQSTETTHSLRAIYAADAGIEWGFYEIYKTSVPKPIFSGTTSVEITCYDVAWNTVPCDGTLDANSRFVVRTLRSDGKSLNAQRVFAADL